MRCLIGRCQHVGHMLHDAAHRCIGHDCCDVVVNPNERKIIVEAHVMRCCEQVALVVEVIKKMSGDTEKVSQRLAADRCDETLRYCCCTIMMMIDEKRLECGGVCIDCGGCMMMMCRHAIDDVDESRGALGQRLLIHAVVMPEARKLIVGERTRNASQCTSKSRDG